MKIENSIKECRYCGIEEYYIKQSYTWACKYFIRFDGNKSKN